MILEICTKNGALVRSVEVDSPNVPRVGEVVYSPADADYLQGIDSLLVVDVHHVLSAEGLTTVVRCMAQGTIDSQKRLELLLELGWLPLTATAARSRRSAA